MMSDEPKQPNAPGVSPGSASPKAIDSNDDVKKSESSGSPQDAELEGLQKLRKSADQLVQEISRLKSQADTSVGDIQSAKGTVEALVKIVQTHKDKLDQIIAQTGESQNKAFEASNAISRLKESVHTEAKDIHATKVQVDASAAQIAQQKGAADANAASIQQLMAQVKAASKSLADNEQIGESTREAIEKTKVAAAEHLDACVKGRVEIEAVVAQLASWRTNANDNFNAVTQAKSEIEAALNAIVELKAKTEAAHTETTAAKEQAIAEKSAIEELHQQIQSLGKQATTLKDTIETHAKATQGLAERSEGVEANLNQHEGNLKALHQQFDVKYAELHKRIESLLPGAASAGLAGAFRKRKETFSAPKVYWLGAFAFTLVLLVVAAAVEFAHSANSNTIPKTWDEFLLHLLIRLPIAFPLIWFALYTAKQATIARRLEEDYAYKESISMAFEGYKREMREVSKDGDPNSPVIKLSTTVIETLGASPDRIYDKKGLHGSPLSHAADVVNDSQAALMATTAVAPPREAIGQRLIDSGSQG